MDDEIETLLCVTAQHRDLLDGTLRWFGLSPDFDLDLMQPEQTLTGLTGRMLAALEPVITSVRPDMTLLQGDTTTTFCGALSSFYAGVPISHVEAGLRTYDIRSPFPEEMNRAVVTQIATMHFAPTVFAAENLARSGVSAESIHVTGNTGIDAVLATAQRLAEGMPSGLQVPIDDSRKLLVVTAHRRESFGSALEQICEAIAELAQHPDVQIIWPVHPNPNIEPMVRSALAGIRNVNLIEPLDYAPFVDLLRKAYLVITDSGGMQEEGPSLGKPILVLRDKTERPEAVSAGTAKLVGRETRRIAGEANRLLEDAAEYQRMAQIQNPYGDGHASERIAGHIRNFLRKNRGPEPSTGCFRPLP